MLLQPRHHFLTHTIDLIQNAIVLAPKAGVERPSEEHTLSCDLAVTTALFGVLLYSSQNLRCCVYLVAHLLTQGVIFKVVPAYGCLDHHEGLFLWLLYADLALRPIHFVFDSFVRRIEVFLFVTSNRCL